jgi:hypothetical protein
VTFATRDDRSNSSSGTDLTRYRLTRLLAGLLAVGGVATATLAFEPGPDVGLKGIFPTQVPAALEKGAFDKIDGNWATWSAETAALVESFYKFEGDFEAQKQGVDGLKKRLAQVDKALADSRYQSLFGPLTSIRGPLAARVDLADALLSTMSVDLVKAKQNRVSAAKQGLTAALSGLESYLKGIPRGEAWIPFMQGAELKAALAGTDEAAQITTAGNSLSLLEAGIAKADPTQKAFLERQPFARLTASLKGYLASTSAPTDTGSIRTEAQTLVSALEGYLAKPNDPDALKVRQSFQKLRDLSPDGGAKLSAALQNNVFNYNLRIVASEAFLSKLMADSRRQQGQVTDFILGANVSGNQTTDTNVTINLKPSNSTARFDLVLTGTIQSSTVGVTDQASVYTQGNHTFYATKEVNFDGERFATSPAAIQVNPNNTTTGIATRYSGGLFGGIADRIAANEVASKKGQSEAIAASRVQDRVLPEFNREVDSSMAKAQQEIEAKLFGGLKEVGLFPETKAYQTTDNELRVQTRLMASGELAANTPPPSMYGNGGATLLMHESILNNSLDRMNLAGKTLNDEELRQTIQAFLKQALRREIKFPTPSAKPEPAAGEEESDKGPNAFIFAGSDPVRVKVEDGKVLIVIRAGFKTDKGEDIPTVEVTIPIGFTVQGREILVTGPEGPAQVRVADVDGSTGIAVKGVIRKKILRDLPNRLVSGVVKLNGPSRSVEAVVRDIKAYDGWVSINVQ